MALKPLKTLNFGGEDTYFPAPEWENVQNPPFGETTTYSDTLTWDGNTEGLVSIDVLSAYKVSDATPMPEDFQNGMTMIVDTHSGQETIPVTSEEILYSFDRFSEYAYTVEGNILVSLADNVDSGDDYIIPEKGIYFTKTTEEVEGDDWCLTSLTINGYNGFGTTEIKPIDIKYLPKSHQFGEETVTSDAITWDGNTDGLESVMGMVYHISNATPTLEDLQNGGTLKVFTPDGEMSVEFTGDQVMDAESVGGGTNLIVIDAEGLPVIIATSDNATMTEGEETIAFPKAGVYLPCMDGMYTSSFAINGYTFTETEVETIDIKYLPKQLQIGETTETISGDTLTWDGDMTGKPVVSLDMGDDGVMNFCKVSNAVPTIEDLSDGLTMTAPGFGTNSLPADELDTGAGYISAEAMVIISKPNTTVDVVGLTFPETGTWLVQQSVEGMSMYVGELIIPNYTDFERTVTTVKKLDKKFYDGADVSGYFVEEFSDTLTWDVDIRGRTKYEDTPPSTYDNGKAFVRVSNKTLTLQELSQGGSIVPYGINVTGKIDFTSDKFVTTENGLMLGNVNMGVLIVTNPNEALPIGIYFSIMYNNEGEVTYGVESLTINGYNEFSKYRLAHPYDTSIKTVGGLAPDKQGNVDIASLFTESEDKTKEYCESNLKRYKNIKVTSSTDDSGATVYTANMEFTDMMNLVGYQDVRLSYYGKIYHLMDTTPGYDGDDPINYLNIYRFVNIYMEGTIWTISQFTWKRPSSVVGPPTLTHSYRHI